MSDDFKGRGGSPWGTPPGGGGNGSGRGPTPPDIDAIIKDIQNKIIVHVDTKVQNGSPECPVLAVTMEISGFSIEY